MHTVTIQVLFRTSFLSLLAFFAGCTDSGSGTGTEAGSSQASTSESSSAGTTIASPLATSSAEAGGQLQVVAQTQPPVRVNPSVLNWGVIGPNQPVTGSVMLQNVSNEPQTIVLVQPSCKCTTTDGLAGTVIPPKGQVKLEATLDAQPNAGTRNTVIRVLFEGYSKVLNITAKAEVTRPVKVDPHYINAISNDDSGVVTKDMLSGTFNVKSLDESPFRILSVQGMEPDIVRGGDAEAPTNDYVLAFDLDRHLQANGRYPRFLVIETDRSDAPLIEVLVRHKLSTPTLNRNFKLTNYKANLGRLAPGGSIMHAIGIHEATTVGELVQVICEGGILNAQVIDQSVDAETDDLTANVRFTVSEGTPEGFYYLPIQLYSSSQSVMEIPAFVSVRNTP
jgi:hypothetical protein